VDLVVIPHSLVKEMERYDKAIKALGEPENEALNWLLGSVLIKHSKLSASHFLLDALESPTRTPLLASWNYWIREFRAALVNPEVAPQRANLELGSTTKDAEDKLRSLLAEVFAVLHLKKQGYENFEVLLPGDANTPDFHARLENKKARIEVKNLRKPEDSVRAVIAKRWKENRDARPDEYNFRLLVKCTYRGALSPAATSRVRSIIDQLPITKKPLIDETLDGDVRIRFERPDVTAESGSPLQGIILSQIFEQRQGAGHLVIQGAVMEEDLEFDLPEFQAFFVKVLRVVAEATRKFFGPSDDKDSINVLFLNWEPPHVFVSKQETEYTRQEIESLFGAFKLDLKLIISYQAPEVPLSVLKSVEKKPKPVELQLQSDVTTLADAEKLKE
jgi:hypothetical protein